MNEKTALIRRCDTCGAITAMDCENTPLHRKEMERDGSTVIDETPKQALALLRVSNRCTCENLVHRSKQLELIKSELQKAKAKHSHFADVPVQDVLTREDIESQLSSVRFLLHREETGGHVQGCTVLFCEIWEAVDAYAKGDKEHCIQELAQCAAVIVRMMEAVGNINLTGKGCLMVTDVDLCKQNKEIDRDE